MNTQENNAAHDVDQLVLALRKPVTAVGGKQFTSVTLREPNAGELEKASRALSGVGSLMVLISDVAGVPLQVAEAMCSRDLAEADAFFNTWHLPEPQPQGEDDFEDEKVITLRKPVAIGKGEEPVVYDKLEMVEPNGGQKDKASRESNDTRAAIVLISLVAKVPRAMVERLCRRDFEDACNFLGSCNVVAPKTGATSLRN